MSEGEDWNWEVDYPDMPAKLSELVRAQRAEKVARLEKELERLRSCSELEYAKGYGIELGSLLPGGTSFAWIRPDPYKSPGRWRVYADHSEFHRTHEEILACFRKEG